jgi:hypothetical protein
VLEKSHITWYREDIVRATLSAKADIEKALKSAKRSLCSGCDYCHIAARHKRILDQVSGELLQIVSMLREGMRPSQPFAKVMLLEGTLYRGFIKEDGSYISIVKTDHSKYRKEYATIYGEEQAYKMINIHSRGLKTYVLFCDRKYPPSAAQYETLKDLMIDAEGALGFDFVFDTKHPCLA